MLTGAEEVREARQYTRLLNDKGMAQMRRRRLGERRMLDAINAAKITDDFRLYLYEALKAKINN